jgi:hypothetical protein
MKPAPVRREFMQPRSFRTLYSTFLSCSLLPFLSACTHGPKITLCVVDPPLLQCVRPDKSSFVVPVDQAANYVALPPEEFQKLYNWMAQNCGGGK